ncbi:MAG TPA: hypothetical protein VGI62_09780 [Phenylobacterium sp.]
MNRRTVRNGLLGLALSIGGMGVGYISGIGHAAPARNNTPLVTLAAQKIGVRQCLPAVTSIAQRGLLGATMQDIVLNWDHQAPDAGPFFSMTGMGAAVQRATLSITAVPVAGGSCAVLVERVSSGADNCSIVATRDLPPMPGGKLIDGITVYQNPKQPEETYTLVQNPGSCIVIRRQVVFKWSAGQ